MTNGLSEMLLKCGPENKNWEGVESKTEFILTTL